MGPQGIARTFDPQSTTSANDPQRKIHDSINGCYRNVLELLESLDFALDSAIRSHSAEQSAQSQIQLEEIDALRNSAYQRAQSSNDDLFHIALYDWLMSLGRNDQLLTIGLDTPYFEEYLSVEPSSFEKLDLLWQLYVRRGAGSAAAVVLKVLAESQE